MQARLVGAILPLVALPGISRWYAASDVFGLKIQDGFAPTFSGRRVLLAGCPGSPGLLFLPCFLRDSPVISPAGDWTPYMMVQGSRSEHF